MNSNHPFWNRPRIFDKNLQRERRLFWNELSDEQRMAELDWHNKENKEILRKLGPKLQRHGIEQTIISHKVNK